MRCQAGEAETALRRALDHARQAGDERTEYESLSYLLGTALFGPLPVDEGISRAEAALEHPSKLLRAAALRTLAVLRAMEGGQAEARRLVAENKQLLNDLGLRYLAASAATEHGSAEMLLGDLAVAEQELRDGYGVLEEMGETSGLSTVSALLAASLAAQGKAQEALRFADLSEESAAGVDLQTLIPARRARARALAALGQLEEAEAVARHAVELAQGTDWLNLHADARMSLAYVLMLASKVSEAATAANIALQLYEQKGNVVSAQRARTALAETFIPA
jgi:tetratricopeptide (TPR) repeat protein